MNEKIKELAEEAGFMEGWFSESGDDCEREIKKFAELIVAECIEVFGRDLPEPGDGKMLEVINRLCNVAEHFGVEE